ncbi:MAG: TraB/GumN family protein, partial [Deltaproteobacteria bacterium]|nr:TraB/GumN family protein [Deltaproteobacteria bacterium]
CTMVVLAALTALACKHDKGPATTENETPPSSAQPRPAVSQPDGTPGTPFLWRVNGKGTEESYLFGTMHLGVNAEKQIHPSVWSAFDKSEQVVVEIISSEIGVSQTQELFFLKDPQGLRKGLNDSQWQTLAATIKGYPDAQLARTSPLMASVLITSSWLPTQPPMDQYIENRARSARKSVHGLEGFEETKAFAHSDYHMGYLAMMLDDLDKAKTELLSMHAAYLRGDRKAMVELVFSEENLAKFPKLYEELFLARNKAWVPKLERHFQNGRTFVAVGAGHLLGKDSVVAMLEARGYEVEPIAR